MNREEELKCKVCGGNNKDMPCAYPGDCKEGCLRDIQADAIIEKILFNDE